jgi:hypothetical protein
MLYNDSAEANMLHYKCETCYKISKENTCVVFGAPSGKKLKLPGATKSFYFSQEKIFTLKLSVEILGKPWGGIPRNESAKRGVDCKTCLYAITNR